MVINLLMGEAMAAFAEGMILGQSLGISQEMLLEFCWAGRRLRLCRNQEREGSKAGNTKRLSASLDAKGLATGGSDRLRNRRRAAAGECDERDLQVSHAPGEG